MRTLHAFPRTCAYMHTFERFDKEKAKILADQYDMAIVIAQLHEFPSMVRWAEHYPGELWAYVSPIGVEVEPQSVFWQNCRVQAEREGWIWKDPEGKYYRHGTEYIINPEYAVEWAKWLTKEVVWQLRAIMTDNPQGKTFSGLLADNGWRSVSWLTGRPADDEMWAQMLKELLVRLKRATYLPVIGNGHWHDHDTRRRLCGRMFESLPTQKVGWSWFYDLFGIRHGTGIAIESLHDWGASQPRIILQASEAADPLEQKALLALSMCFDGWYSPFLKAAEPIDLGIAGQEWYPTGVAKWGHLSGHDYGIERGFASGLKREEAGVIFDANFDHVVQAWLPWGG